jgi:Tfp pilus assembly protein PilO
MNRPLDPEPVAEARTRGAGRQTWTHLAIRALRQLSPAHWADKWAENSVFLVFVVALLLGYIWNRHLAERQALELQRLMNETRELKSEYLNLNAHLSEKRKQTQITAAVDTLGLEMPKQPPYQVTLTRIYRDEDLKAHR